MNQDKNTIDSFAQKKMDASDWIAELLGKDGMTLNQVVNCRLIKEFFKMKNLEFPSSPTTLSKQMVNSANSKKEKIKKEITELKKNKKYFSATFDEWTAKNGSRYVGVAITTDEKRIGLGLAKIEGRATAENVHRVFVAKLNEFGIDVDDLCSTITDGASLMNSIHKKLPSIPVLCMLHGIHLAVKDTIANPNEFVDTDANVDGEIDDEIVDEINDSVLKPEFTTVLKK